MARIRERDWTIAEHLKAARALTTEQIANLVFEGSVHAARKRLYKLNGEMVKSRSDERVKPRSNVAGARVVWELEKRYFDDLARTDDRYPDLKYPGPVGKDLPHTIAANDVYVDLVACLTPEFIPGLQLEDWNWLSEPFCHRRHHERRFILKPDAEIELFGGVFYLERQTGAAQEKPEKIHDKVFGYHSYENSLERHADARPLVNLWACDTGRDADYALAAARNHPTKPLREFGLREHDRKRMKVIAAEPDQAVMTIFEAAQDAVKNGRRFPY